MSESDDMNGFSAETIRLYLEGKMSNSEMHAFEKEAMEDPFLADAMDGILMDMQSRGTEAFGRDTRELSIKLGQRIAGQRTNRKYILMFLNWQSAAAVFVLAAAIFITYTLVIKRNNPQQSIAVEQVQEKKADTLQSTPVIEPSAAPVSEPSAAAANKPVNITPLANDKAARSVAGASAKPIVAQADKKSSKDEIMSINEPVSGIEKDKSNDDIADNKLKRTYSPMVKTDTLNAHPDTSSNSLASNSVAAAQPKQKAAAPDSKHRAGVPLNEVVILSYSTQVKPDTGEDEEYGDTASLKKGEKVSVVKAVPADGWKAYSEYLRMNKKITTADSTIRGNEIVSFLVDINGGVSSFKIEKSLSPAHDAEAIRLVKSGPAWRLLKGKKERATATISF